MADRDKELAELLEKGEKDWNERSAAHAELLNLIENVPEDAPEEKRRELLGIINDKIRSEPVDKNLKFLENHTRKSFGNDYHSRVALVIVNNHIKAFKKKLNEAIAKGAPPDDTEMAMGGKKRRGKKTKKTKKSRRITRRR